MLASYLLCLSLTLILEVYLEVLCSEMEQLETDRFQVLEEKFTDYKSIHFVGDHHVDFYGGIAYFYRVNEG